jgi:hypothetical protein
MNIQNHTRLPDVFWDKLLHAAKKAIGIEFDTSDTIAELATARGGFKHGLAWNRKSAYIGRGVNRYIVTCEHRWFKIWCPIPRRVDTNSSVDISLGYVLSLFKTAAHELRHIADYHLNDSNPSNAPFKHRSEDGRRIPWVERPHEQRAIKSGEDAIEAYKTSPEIKQVVDECVDMYREFMKKVSTSVVKKVKVYPTEPIVQLTKLQHDWMYERVVFNYEGQTGDTDRETLIFHLRKGLGNYQVELSDMGARKAFCGFLNDMRWSSDSGEARSAGRLKKQLWRRGLWVMF